MSKTRPEQGRLTKDNDLSKTEETRRTVEGMVDGLNDHVIDGIGAFFHEKFRWMGNAGCGTKQGLKEFQDNWQRPFQAAFSEKACTDEARIAEGEWMAAFGAQAAIHSGTFMGIPPTGKRVEISELVKFATEYLKLDYVFWGTEEPFYSEQVIPFLRRVK